MITQKELKERVHYNHKTGHFSWIKSKKNVLGKRAGSFNRTTGYRTITFNYYNYTEHRLAYLYMNGKWPRKYIDHINRIRDDNRWNNLREVTQSENCCNSKIHNHNTSGYKNIHWHKKISKWTVGIQRNRKKIIVGYFTSIKAAIRARNKVIKKHGY